MFVDLEVVALTRLSEGGYRRLRVEKKKNEEDEEVKRVFSLGVERIWECLRKEGAYL